jgi:hypothetical protein
MNKINVTVVNLKQHRRNNFTGAMLMHHAQSSTKYMSRWIEEKNKKEVSGEKGKSFFESDT